MKKILMFFIGLLTITGVYAQTVLSSNFVEDTYVGVNGGVFGYTKPTYQGYENFAKSLKGSASLRVGKYFTPSFGLELDGSVGMSNRSTFVDHTNVSLNALVNMNNLIHGYKGTCDKVEFVPFVGVGWFHTYGNLVSNNMSGKGGLQVNWNFDKNRSWQLNFRPHITYVLTNNGFGNVSDFKFTTNRAFVTVEVGVTYKFKNRKKTHNFVLCPNKYKQSDMDGLMQEVNSYRALYEDCRNKLSVTMNDVKRLEMICDSLRKREMVTQTFASTAVGFEIGSSELLTTSKATLLTLVKSIKDEQTKVLIVGYADAQTGSDERNMEISEMRVETVKNMLVEHGIDEGRIETLAKGATEQIFEVNEINRVVTIKVE